LKADSQKPSDVFALAEKAGVPEEAIYITTTDHIEGAKPYEMS